MAAWGNLENKTAAGNHSGGGTYDSNPKFKNRFLCRWKTTRKSR